MKNLLTLFGCLLITIGSAQTASVIYTSSSAVISNPERGFYKYSAAHSTDYNLLNQTTLNNYRLNNNITVLYRYFYLENFRTSAISATYLANMQSDFDKLRNAGMKCVIRFAYTDDEGMQPRDASKAQILAHILQLKPLLIANADVIMAMQAGFIGTWGEWYFTSQSDFGGWGYNDTNQTTTQVNNMKEVLNAILSALPANRMVQVRKPAFKRSFYGTAATTAAQAFSGTGIARVGLHNDCFLATEDDYGTYDNLTTEVPYLQQDSKYTPVGGETCQVNSPRSDCASAVTEMANMHWSYLNSDYNPGVLANFTDGGCMTEITKRLGYRFELKSGTYPQNATAGTSMSVTIKVKNTGFAAPFNERHVYLILKNTVTNQIYPIQMATNPRLWLGPNDITITESLLLPATLATGTYKLYLNLPDASPSLATRPEYSIRMANESTWENTTGYNNLNHTVAITSLLGVADNTKLNLAVYPVPANDQLTVEMEGISDFNTTVYNALGQDVKINTRTENNKIIFETSSLSNGMYFVAFQKGTIRDVRKIVVRH